MYEFHLYIMCAYILIYIYRCVCITEPITYGNAIYLPITIQRRWVGGKMYCSKK